MENGKSHKPSKLIIVLSTIKRPCYASIGQLGCGLDGGPCGAGIMIGNPCTTLWYETRESPEEKRKNILVIKLKNSNYSTKTQFIHKITNLFTIISCTAQPPTRHDRSATHSGNKSDHTHEKGELEPNLFATEFFKSRLRFFPGEARARRRFPIICAKFDRGSGELVRSR